MRKWKCNCGNTVHAEKYPSFPKWNDGHTCVFREEENVMIKDTNVRCPKCCTKFATNNWNTDNPEYLEPFSCPFCGYIGNDESDYKIVE